MLMVKLGNEFPEFTKKDVTMKHAIKKILKAENLGYLMALMFVGLFLFLAIIANRNSNSPKLQEMATEEQTEAELVILHNNEEMQAYIHSHAVKANEELLNRRYLEFISTTEAEPETETDAPTEPEWMPYEFIALSDDVQKSIKAVCDEYEIAYELILAICIQESSLNPLAIGDNGKAYGLGQIREEFWGNTALELGLYDWKTDAVQNAEMVCYIMSRQMKDFHMTMDDALNIYRHGITQDIVEPDGRTYVQHIKQNLEWIESQKEE